MRRLLVAMLGMLALAAGVLFGMGGASADSVYNETDALRLCNALPADFGEATLQGNASCAEVKATSAVRDMTLTSSVTAGSSSIERIVSFVPGSMFEYAQSANTIPAGTTVGGLRYFTTVGVLNGACNMATNYDAVLYNVPLPDNLADPRASGNIVYPRAEGDNLRFGKWQVGTPATDFTGQFVQDANGDNIADSGNIAFLNYPSYLLDYFDPDGAGATPPLVPQALYGGMARVQTEWMPFYLALFPAGGLTTLPAPFSMMNTNTGQPLVYVTGDPTASQQSPTVITDTCAPASVQAMLLGSVGGVDRGKNPATLQTAFFMTYSASRRDLDQDGFENALDTCPMATNAGADSDSDGIDDACDGAVGGTTDVDSDAFLNRGDNCPQTANGTTAQNDAEIDQGGTLANADLGPKADGIGDVCDTGVVAVTQNGQPVPGGVTLSSTVANGRYHSWSHVLPVCIGGTDLDGDGYCAGAGDSADTGVGAAVRHTAWAGSNPGRQMDTDGDKMADGVETYLGTDPTKSCSVDTVRGNEAPLDNWPLDMDDNGVATTLDLAGYASVLGFFVDQSLGAKKRLDLNSDGMFTTLDLTGYVATLNHGCGSFFTPVPPPDGPIPGFSQQ